MATAEDVARYILYLSQQEPEPELMSQMRLHKLVYYCQAWRLAMRDEPLFAERIEAWQHGPVVPSLRPHFGRFGDSQIPQEEARNDSNLKRWEWSMVTGIWARYKKYSATELYRITHAETPWKEARGNCRSDEPSDSEISEDTMKRYFREEFDRQAVDGRDCAYYLKLHADMKAGKGTPLREFVKTL